MSKLTIKEYSEAVEHWAEMAESFLKCDGFHNVNGEIHFSRGKNRWYVNYSGIGCSYCKELRRKCNDCLLYDIQCCTGYSPWRSFTFNPSAKTALNMLTAIVERPPEDVP